MRHKAKAEQQYLALLESVSVLVSSLAELNRQAVREYTPLVEGILRSKSRDAHQIETTLDGLLDFCGDDTALLLYRRLCRYYYGLDPAAAVHYVHAYWERWEESTEEGTQANEQQDTRRPTSNVKERKQQKCSKSRNPARAIMNSQRQKLSGKK